MGKKGKLFVGFINWINIIGYRKIEKWISKDVQRE